MWASDTQNNNGLCGRYHQCIKSNYMYHHQTVCCFINMIWTGTWSNAYFLVGIISEMSFLQRDVWEAVCDWRQLLKWNGVMSVVYTAWTLNLPTYWRTYSLGKVRSTKVSRQSSGAFVNYKARHLIHMPRYVWKWNVINSELLAYMQRCAKTFALVTYLSNYG